MMEKKLEAVDDDGLELLVCFSCMHGRFKSTTSCLLFASVHSTSQRY